MRKNDSKMGSEATMKTDLKSVINELENRIEKQEEEIERKKYELERYKDFHSYASTPYVREEEGKIEAMEEKVLDRKVQAAFLIALVEAGGPRQIELTLDEEEAEKEVTRMLMEQGKVPVGFSGDPLIWRP